MIVPASDEWITQIDEENYIANARTLIPLVTRLPCLLPRSPHVHISLSMLE
jgi:hypothetical protein